MTTFLDEFLGQFRFLPKYSAPKKYNYILKLCTKLVPTEPTLVHSSNTYFKQFQYMCSGS